MKSAVCVICSRRKPIKLTKFIITEYPKPRACQAIPGDLRERGKIIT